MKKTVPFVLLALLAAFACRASSGERGPVPVEERTNVPRLTPDRLLATVGTTEVSTEHFEAYYRSMGESFEKAHPRPDCRQVEADMQPDNALRMFLDRLRVRAAMVKEGHAAPPQPTDYLGLSLAVQKYLDARMAARAGITPDAIVRECARLRKEHPGAPKLRTDSDCRDTAEQMLRGRAMAQHLPKLFDELRESVPVTAGPQLDRGTFLEKFRPHHESVARRLGCR